MSGISVQNIRKYVNEEKLKTVVEDLIITSWIKHKNKSLPITSIDVPDLFDDDYVHSETQAAKQSKYTSCTKSEKAALELMFNPEKYRGVNNVKEAISKDLGISVRTLERSEVFRKAEAAFYQCQTIEVDQLQHFDDIT